MYRSWGYIAHHRSGFYRKDPPQMIISVPVQMAVWRSLLSGALVNDVAAHVPLPPGAVVKVHVASLLKWLPALSFMPVPTST